MPNQIGNLIRFSALVLAIFSGTSARSVETDSLTFDNNSLPPNWQMRSVVGSPGTNYAITGNRFEAGQVDTYAEIARNYGSLAGISYLNVQYDTEIADVFHGMGTSVALYNTAGSSIEGANFQKHGFGLSELYLNIGGRNDSGAAYNPWQIFPPLVLGQYHVISQFRDHEARILVAPTGSATFIDSGWIATPNFALSEVSTVAIMAYTTTGQSSWVDNVTVKMQPVPEVDARAMIFFGIPLILLSCRNRFAQKAKPKSSQKVT